MSAAALPLATPDAPSTVPGRAVLPLATRAAMPPQHLADLDLAGRRALVEGLGHKAFRAEQISRHYFGRLVRDPSRMTDLPEAARDELAAALMPTLLTPVRELTCDAGATRKSLWRLHDGSLVESVLMGYPDRQTVCVSSQAGCGMGCPFCATGQGGLKRNLSTAEIVDQVVWLAGVARQGGVPGVPARLSHVVFMGMGEPLANYNRVVAAVRRLISPPPEGLGLSARHITVSTVGLVPAMRRLAEENLPVTLALSLHAPDDELRNELVPVNERWKVAEVLDAAWGYTARTGRRVSIEYALIRDVNDQPWRADLLGKLLAGRLAHVNLIPLNPTPGSRWDASPKPVEREFVRRLRAAGVAATVRDTRGREIDGACGQLAAGEPVARAGPGAGGPSARGQEHRDDPGDEPSGRRRDTDSQVARMRNIRQDPVGITGNLVQSGWAPSASVRTEQHAPVRVGEVRAEADSRGPGGKAKQ